MPDVRTLRRGRRRPRVAKLGVESRTSSASSDDLPTRRPDGRRCVEPLRLGAAGTMRTRRSGLSRRSSIRWRRRAEASSSGSSQATASASARVGRLEHDLDLGPVRQEARVRADPHLRPAHGRAGEQVDDVALARPVGAPPRRDRLLAARAPRRRGRTSPPSPTGGPGSTQTFSITKPGAPPCGFVSGRLPTGSCAQRAA